MEREIAELAIGEHEAVQLIAIERREILRAALDHGADAAQKVGVVQLVHHGPNPGTNFLCFGGPSAIVISNGLSSSPGRR